eukprot:128006_1
MATHSKYITSFFASIACSLVVYHVIVRFMKKTIPNNGSYEIVPLHKASYMQSKTKQLLATEWPGTKIRLYSSKILPTHLILIHHKNGQNIENGEVIGHVTLKGSLLMNLPNKFITMERLIVDPEYRGYGFGKSLIGITATKSLIRFYDKLHARVDRSFFSNDVSGSVGMYIELANPSLLDKCKTLLNVNNKTYNLILSF